MTTPSEPSKPAERYADLIGLSADNNPAMARLLAHLERTLRPLPAPPQLRTAVDQLLQQRLAATQPAEETPVWAAGPVSRRAALKTGAAGIAWLLTLGHTTPAVARELARFAEEGPMTGPRLASILQTERGRWNALLEQVGPERMELSGVEGAWSMKELVAHLTWYERAVVEGARQVFSSGTYKRRGMAGLGMDERNARIAAESRARSAADVLAEAERVFGELVDIIQICPDDLLNDPRPLGLPEGDDRHPWMLVADNAYAHYRQHEQAVRAWLARMGTGTNAQAGQGQPAGAGEDEA